MVSQSSLRPLTIHALLHCHEPPCNTVWSHRATPSTVNQLYFHLIKPSLANIQSDLLWTQCKCQNEWFYPTFALMDLWSLFLVIALWHYLNKFFLTHFIDAIRESVDSDSCTSAPVSLCLWGNRTTKRLSTNYQLHHTAAKWKQLL